MDTFIHFGMAAAIQAVRDAGPAHRRRADEETAERIGCIVGSGIGGLPMIEQTHDEYRERGPRRISPFFVPASIINMISGHLSIKFGFNGPNLAIVTACTTGLHCIGEAGRHDRVRRCRRDGRRRRREHRVAAGHRRLCRGAGAVHAQRRPEDRLAALGQGPRRLRARRRRRRAGARGVRARQAPRREDLRRTGRLRHGRRRLPHDRAQRRRPQARDAGGAAQRRHQRRPGAVPQRARHLHAAGRPERDQRHQAGLRRPRQEAWWSTPPSR